MEDDSRWVALQFWISMVARLIEDICAGGPRKRAALKYVDDCESEDFRFLAKAVKVEPERLHRLILRSAEDPNTLMRLKAFRETLRHKTHTPAPALIVGIRIELLFPADVRTLGTSHGEESQYETQSIALATADTSL